MATTQRFQGAWAAVVTPFTAENTVNTTVLKEVVEHLIAKQVEGLYVCGATGQGLALTVAERQTVLETVFTQTRGRIPLMAQVGATALADALTLARHAKELRVDAISSVIPPLHPEMAALCAYFQAVAAAAPELPFFPYLFGFPKAVELMQALLPIPNVAGTKYTGPNMFELQQIAELRRENWAVFSGMDEQCVFARLSGVAGNIGSTLNFMPGAYRQMHACLTRGELAAAMTWQQRANVLTGIMIKHGFQAALAEVMGVLGFPCGRVRLPHPPLPESQRAGLIAALKAAGFDELTRL